jgi:hypothetical protein
MVVFPKKTPVANPLNSYYVDMPKLCEHYQGAIGTGVIHCKSHSAEACVFFDKDELLNGIFYHNGDEITGKAAIDRVLNSNDHNYEIHIYSIPSENIYFWSNIPSAKKIYDDLSSEFADLEGLIRKMSSERLTGYIYVSINGDNENGFIFFINGEILASSYSWGSGVIDGSNKDVDLLIKKSAEVGGLFQVKSISLKRGGNVSQSSRIRKKTVNPLPYIEELLVIFERVVISEKKIKTDFTLLLKNKFMEQVGKYPFLDPFVAEFEYSDHQVVFTGDPGEKDLLKGVTESVKELAEEIGLLGRLQEEIQSLQVKYSKYGSAFNLIF